MSNYFLYKNINMANVGGIFPKTDDSVITLGICENNNYYLGSTSDPNEVTQIKGYFVTFITDEEAAGFQILNNTEITEGGPDPESTTTRDLTSTELTNQNLAKRLMLKLQLRPNLETVFSDIPDMLADANKKYELIERIFMEVMLYLIQGNTVPSEIINKYLPLIEMYNDKLSTDDITIRGDIESNLLTFYTNLVNKTNTMNDMVNNLYLSIAPA